jgi:hypothetical protein
LWGSIRENEDQNNQGRVESLVSEHVGVVDWSLIGLGSHQVQDVDVRSYQDKDVLQEDVLVVDGQAQKTSCSSSSQEEEDRLENSPL